MLPFIYVTRRIPSKGIEILKRIGKVEIYEGETPPPKDLIVEKVKGADALLSLLTDPIDEDVLRSAEKLKVVSNYAVGYDNIDVETATKLGIMVTNTPGILTEATAELTWALIFAVTRKIVQADRYVREGKFKGWSPTLFLGTELCGKTLGVLGFGRIGQAVAKKASAFSMKVIYTDRRRKEEGEGETGAQFVSLPELLTESDILTIHVPLTRETHHLIGEEELKKMKPSAYLINTSRGPVVDERALIKALKDNWIAGCGLDVYEWEPFVPDELKEMENVILLPHIGSATVETRELMAITAAKNIESALKGEIPTHLVNPEVLKRNRIYRSE
jgi:glyoxylate reductase